MGFCEGLKQALSRRDFLKLKLLSAAYALMPSLVQPVRADVVVDPLVQLESLDFSRPVKKELTLRINLHRRYGIDALGKPVTLTRFLKESINFILAYGDLRDIQLFHSVAPGHMEYLLMRAAYHGREESFFYFANRLIGRERNHLVGQALFAALDNHAMEMFYSLIKLRPQVSRDQARRLHLLLQKDRYDQDFGQAQKLLPHLKRDAPKPVTHSRVDYWAPADYQDDHEDDHWEFSFNAKLSCIAGAVRATLHVLVSIREISDYDIRIRDSQIHVETFNAWNRYSIDFPRRFNAILQSYMEGEAHDLVDLHNILVMEMG